MLLGTSYAVLITAFHTAYLTYTIEKLIHIDTASPDLEVASIIGGNRYFSANDGFTL